MEKALLLADGTTIDESDLGLGPVGSGLRSLSAAVDDFKRAYIADILARCGGNRTRAAKILDVDPRTVFRFLEAEKDG